jgi:putative phosphoribosyl transferase
MGVMAAGRTERALPPVRTTAAGLCLPDRASALVVLADEEGAGDAPGERNRWLISFLLQQRLATLWCGLSSASASVQGCELSGVEQHIAQQGERLAVLLDWVAGHDDLAGLGLGLLGSGAGAAVVLRMAAARPGQVRAVVTRGGRLDLASNCLAQVFAPTLLIVGDGDAQAVAASRQVLQRLACRRRLEVVPGARSPDEEPGALATVAALAAAWFKTCVVNAR